MNYLSGLYIHVQLPGDNNSYAFKEVSGLSAKINTEKIQGDEENQFSPKVPNSDTNNNLVLAGGLIPYHSQLAKWCKDVFDDFNIKEQDIRLELKDDDGVVLRSWNFVKAYPVSWYVSFLSESGQAPEIKSLELAYQSFS